MSRSSAVVVVLVAALAVGAASCGAGSTEPTDAPLEPAVVNDPALMAAAASARPWLEESYADSFAGIELNHGERVMIVYRRPDPLLDAELAQRVDDVRVLLRDARYSLAEMTDATQRVLAAESYWRANGTAISSIGPAVDGSGLVVATSGDPEALASALATRFTDMSFDVRQQTITLPVFTSPPPVWGQTP